MYESSNEKINENKKLDIFERLSIRSKLSVTHSNFFFMTTNEMPVSTIGEGPNSLHFSF